MGVKWDCSAVLGYCRFSNAITVGQYIYQQIAENRRIESVLVGFWTGCHIRRTQLVQHSLIRLFRLRGCMLISVLPVGHSFYERLFSDLGGNKTRKRKQLTSSTAKCSSKALSLPGMQRIFVRHGSSAYSGLEIRDG